MAAPSNAGRELATFTLNAAVAQRMRQEHCGLPRVLPSPSCTEPSSPPVVGPEEESTNPVSAEAAVVAVAGQQAASANTTALDMTPTSTDATKNDTAGSDQQRQGTGRRSSSRDETPPVPQVRLGIPKRPATASIDAGKALKRPFKSPTRVALQPASLTAAGSPPQAPSPLPSPSSLPASIPRSQASRAPPSPKSTSSRSRRTNTPFKPPTPSSSPATSRSSRSNRNPDAQLIASLEERLRTLKQASKCSEDEHVLGLIRQWREAGREITERLFRMIPEPEPNSTLPARGGGGWGWGWDDATSCGPQVSEEQSRYLREECRVEKGEIVNGDGERVYDDEVQLEDVLPDQLSSGTFPPVRPRFFGVGFGAQEEKEAQPWTRGAMLSKLGVDPSLLGFNDEEDDWDDVEDL